ncbi:MAG: hypothetical protein Q8S73_25910 [Deltaproteobacteria bacterium]|nr:hypothetical protein [Myxococcales bacterium]MDP3217573.1 hypothetical protein [Deltaproteobacteria bacterium]
MKLTPWEALYRQHLDLRTSGQDDFAVQVRGRLTRLAELGHCDGSIRGRFTHNKNHNAREWYIKGPLRDGTEPLSDLPGLSGAELTVLAMQRGSLMSQFTVMLRGVADEDRDWTIAVHLDPEPRGEGACGHALLHCHVGPTLDARPRVRVPFPAIGLPDALDWVLSQVIPGWEPSPWLSSAVRGA